MKITVVPAQITTMEDRIAGNLGLSQLLLLAAPVFGGSALYVVLPPNMHSADYKLIAIATLYVVCSLLAIRIRSKILLFWIILLLRYNLRPRYYVFNKRSLFGRDNYSPVKLAEEEEVSIKPQRVRKPLSLSVAELIGLQEIMENPAANLSFETKKGNLYVNITEVNQKS